MENYVLFMHKTTHLAIHTSYTAGMAHERKPDSVGFY